MKRIFCLLALALSACAPSIYTADDLAARNAKYAEGEVVNQSRGSFIIKDQAGDEIHFRTGQVTQYIPENYRSQEGDIVKVAYEEIWERSGRAKLAVLQLTPISIPEKNLAPSGTLTGRLVSSGPGSSKYGSTIVVKTENRQDAYLIYVPYEGATVDIYGKPKHLSGFTWPDLYGKEVEFEIQFAPILRGNGYIYEAKRVTIK